MHPVTAVLEVNSFSGTDAVGSEAARTIKELERIAKALEKIVAAYSTQP
jgi:hypothetical protein